MATTQSNPQERIARESLTQNRPLFLGIDGGGAAHYWDSYAFAVAVVDPDGRAETVDIAETPFETLAGWCAYTQAERGWDTGPYVGGSLVSDLVQAVEA